MRTWNLVTVLLFSWACAESKPVPADAALADASVLHDASRPADAAARDASHPHDAASDAAVPDSCRLPPLPGSCEAYFQRYAWNPKSGACEKFIYGGCGGNANNFETALACLLACVPSGDAGASRPAACKVGDAVYPSGASGIKDPHSCNQCSCQNGQLGCTKIACPEACPPNAKESTGCAACGPVDNCEIVEHGCFPVCNATSDCAGTPYGFCIDNACKNVCG